MKNYQLQTRSKRILADLFTPVSLYLKLRKHFPDSVLLESSDYHGNENSFSYICFKAIASFKVHNETVTESFPDGRQDVYSANSSIPERLHQFIKKFNTELHSYNFICNGLFGYTAYDAVRYFEDIQIGKKNSLDIPDIFYSAYRFVIAINHFNNEMYLFEHSCSQQKGGKDAIDIAYVQYLIENTLTEPTEFYSMGDEHSNMTNDEFMGLVTKAKQHCQRGDVFQMVLSRQFSQAYKGDDFNLYRVLRSVNPSPYLFYFDFGDFRIFGSSPEAQLVIKKSEASIYPIAGTFRRTGKDEADAELAEKLRNDPKENAEHVMLVDLARNDLSRNCEEVEVKTFREIQYYSHVIHLVSKVAGKLNGLASAIKVAADTFPAGTLSGAPKHKAMQLIEKYENTGRGFYGGSIGYIGFNGDYNHAIIIRSFIAKKNTLYYRAGAGIVVNSNEQSELEEVNNKLAALKKAIKLAEEI